MKKINLQPKQSAPVERDSTATSDNGIGKTGVVVSFGANVAPGYPFAGDGED